MAGGLLAIRYRTDVRRTLGEVMERPKVPVISGWTWVGILFEARTGFLATSINPRKVTKPVWPASWRFHHGNAEQRHHVRKK